MSDKISPTDDGEPALPENSVPAVNTPKSRLAGLLKMARVRPRRSAIFVGIGLMLVVAGYALFFRHPDEEDVAVKHEPTVSERFQLQLDELLKSQEAVARLDALTINDEMLSKLCAIERLTTIQVDTESVSMETIKKLASMPLLEQLHLRGAEITDEMVAELAKSKTIWLLNLPNTKLTPEGIERLAEMPVLRQLRLGIIDGDNRHGRSVSKIARLRAIHLIGVGVTDEGLRSIAHMPNLESLYLDDAAVTDTGWLWLFQENPQLHVHVNQLHHDRDPNKH